jgi:folate-binding Fe-S cluster repair protein YgfZ
MDYGIYELHGIAFDKGCFMGQELTASMKNKDLSKKRLTTVKLDSIPEGAELKSQCNGYGLALVRITP